MFNFLKKKTITDVRTEEPKTGLILHFKDGIKSHRFETYRNVSILYLSKPFDPTQDPNKTYYTYHFFWKGQIEYGEAEDLETLREMVVAEVDRLIAQ